MANKMKEDFERELDDIMRTGKKFAIWGAGREGQMGIAFIEKYSQNTIAPEYIVDNNPLLWKTGRAISPKTFFEKMNDIEVMFIFVYVAGEVKHQLRENGFDGKCIPVVNTVINTDYWLSPYIENPDKVKEVSGLFADQRSIDTIDAYLNVGRTGDIEYWKAVNGTDGQKGLDVEILKPTEDERFVDVGAFTGDTIEMFLRACNGKYRSILGIEPDPGNYSVLKGFLEKYENALALNIACGDETGTVGFSTGHSEGGYLSKSGETQVKISRLDEVAEAEDMTLLKVSAVGYDMLVLKGAERFVKKNSPKLSYYCSMKMMWEIPLFLKSIVPEYRFYLRHYGIGMQGLVGYAVVE